MRLEEEEEGRFLWVGNHPALDLINTEQVRQGQRVDLLGGIDDLIDWMEAVGLLTEAVPLPISAEVAESILADARNLRAWIRKAADEVVAGRDIPAVAIETVNTLLRTRIGYRQIVTGKATLTERFVALEEGEPEAVLRERMLVPLAEVAADLWCRQNLSLVRCCENPNCILYFLDTTKNHARRWCRMSACGNRAKAATHYRRLRAHTHE